MGNSDLILKRQVNNGLAYAIIFAVGVFIVYSMIFYIKAKTEDLYSGYTIVESE